MEMAEKVASNVAPAQHLDPVLSTPEPPVGEYRTVVIDPPWPVQKIERDVRLNQAAPLDYPVNGKQHASGRRRNKTTPAPAEIYDEGRSRYLGGRDPLGGC